MYFSNYHITRDFDADVFGGDRHEIASEFTHLIRKHVAKPLAINIHFVYAPVTSIENAICWKISQQVQDYRIN